MAKTTTRTEYELSEPDENGESTIIGETVVDEFDDSVDADLKRAQAESARAQAAAFAADEKSSLADARKTSAEAERAEIELRKALRNEAEELAGDKHNHTFLFDQEVTEASVKKCVQQLTQWERLATEPLTVELVINSPGGSIFDGLALVDYIDGVHQRGHTVNTIAYGMAASMAGVLLQVGKQRAMGRNAMLLIHEAQFGAIGSFGEIEDRVRLIETLHENLLDLFVARAQPINSKTTKAFIKRNWSRRDWWLTAQESARLGFCDVVL